MQQRQGSHSAISETGYLLRLLVCLGALLALRLVAVYAAKTDLVLDEAQYWTWSRELAFGYFSKPPMIAWLIRGTSEICGNSEACIRSASPVLYTLASVMIYLTARALYDAKVGFWSAIVFATLPGVSYSSLLITTDVPLVLCWTVVLYAWVMLVKRPSLGFAVLLGAAIGFGLLAKQAMLYAFLCIGCHAVVSQEARNALKGGRGILAASIALVLFAPNIIWNAQHGFPTVKHTEANIGWQFPYIHPLRLLEYVSVQFAVFGPILLVVLLRTAWREIPKPSDRRKVLLLSLSLPVLGLLVVQSLLSRAHGNWSATAYPAAAILVTAVMLELNRQVLFRVSLGLHLAIAAVLGAAPAFAPKWRLFEELQFLSRVVGWRDSAEVVRAKLAEERYGSILADTREMAGELLYYLRDVPTPIYVWPSGPTPKDHYEMTRPFTAASPEPVLYVSLEPCPSNLADSFGAFTRLGEQRVVLVEAKSRTLHFCRLADYKKKPLHAPEAAAP
ncbi:MAG: glycosyltransferase family 39 protein [Methyloceanibacter sp.]|jgi:4-amino-4-deoxy-L-arabinose transferase-like glycosyltransferase|nr:glycosyltransferase family 39 protein [Methyloceanibacter sp.]